MIASVLLLLDTIIDFFNLVAYLLMNPSSILFQSILSSFAVKNNPDKNVELRIDYDSVKPGFHMNKKHWNTVIINKDAPDVKIKKWITESYWIVRGNLPKKVQREIDAIDENR